MTGRETVPSEEPGRALAAYPPRSPSRGIMDLLFAHVLLWGRDAGEHFYNFQGLRAFKEKFEPEWEARYLACSGGLALPRVLTHVGSLVGGGLTGMVRK